MAGPTSEAESSVMEVLWEGSPRTAEDVVAALRDRQAWQEATVKTRAPSGSTRSCISARGDFASARNLPATLP